MILDKDNYPKNDMKDNEIDSSKKLTFLETFGSKLKDDLINRLFMSV